MKKIATVTIYNRYNLGNRLQAYALQNFLKIIVRMKARSWL